MSKIPKFTNSEDYWKWRRSKKDRLKVRKSKKK